jgi:hypothetical protein
MRKISTSSKPIIIRFMEKYYEMAIAALIDCIKNGTSDKALEEAQFNLQNALGESAEGKTAELLESIKQLRGL